MDTQPYNLELDALVPELELLSNEEIRSQVKEAMMMECRGQIWG